MLKETELWSLNSGPRGYRGANPGTCDCDQAHFADAVTDFKLWRLSWTIRAGPKWNHGCPCAKRRERDLTPEEEERDRAGGEAEETGAGSRVEEWGASRPQGRRGAHGALGASSRSQVPTAGPSPSEADFRLLVSRNAGIRRCFAWSSQVCSYLTQWQRK